MFVKPITILTKTYNEMDLLTRQVEQIVAESGGKGDTYNSYYTLPATEEKEDGE